VTLAATSAQLGMLTAIASATNCATVAALPSESARSSPVGLRFARYTATSGTSTSSRAPISAITSVSREWNQITPSTITTNSLSTSGSSQPPMSGPTLPRRFIHRARLPSSVSVSAATAISATAHVVVPYAHQNPIAIGIRDSVSACASHMLQRAARIAVRPCDFAMKDRARIVHAQPPASTQCEHVPARGMTYSPAMQRASVLVALGALSLFSCKKEPPAGLPPAADWQGGQPQGSAPASPQADNPHGGMGSVPDPAANPHGATNPHGSGGGAPDVPMPTQTAPATLEKLSDGRVVLGPFTLVAPKEWTIKPVTSSMRAAHFEVSGKAGEEAELVVFYFGEGGAGGVEANLERWLGQFTQPDGKASKDVAKIEKTKFAGQEATVVSVTGRYATSQMAGGPPPVDVALGAMIGAIVSSPSGPYYFKLTGVKKTVDANAARFRAMLASMKLK